MEAYTYNHRGERVLRTPTAGGAQVTLYDEAGQWLGNYSASGLPLQQAIWLDNYPVALISVPVVGVPEPAYIQPGHLGTPRVVIDPVRDVAIWERSNKSEVFGNQAPRADPDGDGVAFELSLRFPGQQATDASGMFYNYQRDYDPVVGRYSQSDPIGLVGGLNTYLYATGSPLSTFDPDGLEAVGSFNNGGTPVEWEKGSDAPVLSQLANTLDTLRARANDMVERNYIDADKFYHCLAMCEVASRGELDASFAASSGVARKLYQQYVKGETAKECAADNRANGQGIAAGLRGQSYPSSCASLMPSGFTFS